MADTVRVIARPPIVYLLGIIVSIGLQYHFFSYVGRDVSLYLTLLSLLNVIIGISFVIWGWNSLAKHHVDPNFKPVGTFVAKGPYLFSRNPIYLGFTFIYLGIAFYLKSFIPFILLLFILLYIQKGVIKREEEYLLERFGDEYIKYKEQVGRWL